MVGVGDDAEAHAPPPPVTDQDGTTWAASTAAPPPLPPTALRCRRCSSPNRQQQQLQRRPNSRVLPRRRRSCLQKKPSRRERLAQSSRSAAEAAPPGGSFANRARGEQVAAGWPVWLSTLPLPLFFPVAFPLCTSPDPSAAPPLPFSPSPHSCCSVPCPNPSVVSSPLSSHFLRISSTSFSATPSPLHLLPSSAQRKHCLSLLFPTALPLSPPHRAQRRATPAHSGRNEESIHYSIDLGRTNFRVLRVEVGAGSVIINQKVEHQPISEELTKGTTEDLFNFVALALKSFLEIEDGQDVKRALGFTFSFPVRQNLVSSGSLIRWIKGFSIEDTLGI
ncbi:hypothetical protein GUJ93_ZPchr0008g11602 [Zizania palustris]|uniref:Phosphotransferase n=1 Tax=Zizania palustris TaxID=103762 RepID=A0A8J5R6R9_ZIZPA|nr:hypothetical protein GUJ93_ZPchr0008g11602 [Zizania palustris]